MLPMRSTQNGLRCLCVDNPCASSALLVEQGRNYQSITPESVDGNVPREVTIATTPTHTTRAPKTPS